MTLPMPGTLICETVTADRDGRAATRARSGDRRRHGRAAAGRRHRSRRRRRAGRPDAARRSSRAAPAWEGGRFDGSEETRLGMLCAGRPARRRVRGRRVARRAGASVAEAIGRRSSCRTTTSIGMPDDLEERVRAMRQTGADIVKVAVHGAPLDDCLTLRDACAAPVRSSRSPWAPAGQMTRLCPCALRLAWTYAGHGGARAGAAPTRC